MLRTIMQHKRSAGNSGFDNGSSFYGAERQDIAFSAMHFILNKIDGVAAAYI